MEIPYRPFKVEENEPQGELKVVRGWEIEKNECHSVMGWIRVSTSPDTKVSRRVSRQLT